MGELSKLPNIGAVVEAQLEEVGITTAEQLRKVGSRQAWLRIKAIDSSACMNRLLGLEGAVQGIKKAQLTQEEREDLREFYRAFKG